MKLISALLVAFLFIAPVWSAEPDAADKLRVRLCKAP